MPCQAVGARRPTDQGSGPAWKAVTKVIEALARTARSACSKPRTRAMSKTCSLRRFGSGSSRSLTWPGLLRGFVAVLTVAPVSLPGAQDREGAVWRPLSAGRVSFSLMQRW